VSVSAGVLTYIVDRMAVAFIGAGSTAQQVSVSGLFPKALRLNGAASVSSAFIVQRIESANSRDLADANTSVTLSWYAASSTKTSMTYSVGYATSTDNFAVLTNITSGTVSITSTLTRYSATFTVPAAATTGIAIELNAGALTSGTFDITGVQLEPGTVATPFERRSYGAELALCERYYEFVTAGSRTQASSGNGYGGSGSFRAGKRATPTLTYYGQTGAFNTTGSYSVDYINQQGVSVAATVGGATGASFFLVIYTATAEL